MLEPQYTWLHLGLGSFHRAHQAMYLQRLHEAGDRRWQLAAGNIVPGGEALVDALRAQGGAYTLETVTPEGARRYERIAALRQVLPWDERLSGIVAVGAQPDTRIVSFTVTEAGYSLDDAQADVAALREGRPVRTIYGALASILRERMRAGSGAVTLLNCDNLRHNGVRVREGLLRFLALVGDHALVDWADAHTTCPNAMVDRITPRPTAEVAQRVRGATGVEDAAALMAEDFTQWVIEDDFVAGRPEWERVGVEMVDSVAAHEEAKIRLLNATHSCIAWAGTLAGYRYIHEGVRDPRIRQLAFDYVTEDVIPVLTPSPIDLAQYRDTVLHRFASAALADTNQRVAADGFAKIPGFIAPTLRERLARGEAIDSVAVLPALFLACLQRWHRGELAYEYQDQAMDPAVGHAICAAPDPVAALANDATLWGALAGDGRLLAALRRAHRLVRAFEDEALT